MSKDDNLPIDEGDNRPGESVFDAFQPEPVRITLGEDGLPIEHDPPGNPNVPPLLPENLCCMQQDDGTARCKWYIRQLIPSAPDSFERKTMRRMCFHPAFKSLSGAGYDMTDSAVYACEARDPAYGPTTEELDKRDARTTARAREKKTWRLFRTQEEAAAGKHTLGEDEYERDDQGREAGADRPAGEEPDRVDAGPNPTNVGGGG